MFRNALIKIQARFVDPEEVAAYETTIPNRIHISFKKDDEYFIGFIDEVNEEPIKGLLITQGKTQEELITNLNQLVYTHIKMPEKIRPYYGNRYQPEVGSALSNAGELTLSKA
jgi:hypothetical protein